MQSFLNSLTQYLLPAAGSGAWAYYTMAARFALTLLGVWILTRCIRSLFRGRAADNLFAWLVLPDGARLPVRTLESSVGRSKSSDIQLPSPAVSRKHAVLTFARSGFRISDTGSKSGMLVNGERIQRPTALAFGDEIVFGDTRLQLHPVSARERDAFREEAARGRRVRPPLSSAATLILMTIFFLIAAIQFAFATPRGFQAPPFFAYLGLAVLAWIFFICKKILRSGARFEIETIAFFLCGIGLGITASVSPGDVFKVLAMIAAGALVYALLCWFIGDVDRAMKARYVAGAAAIALFALNIKYGRVTNGAQNWIPLGSFAFQPSEFVKVLYIFAGSATLERLLTTRNLLRFIAFSAVCILPLFYIRDFGTAAIFFVTFLVIAFLRSGDLRAISLIVAAAVMGGIAIFISQPYVLRRFAIWGHIWDDPAGKGYQQTRTLIALANGGLLGLGPGDGNLRHVFAADSDLAFGVLGEEWGLLLALLVMLTFVALALFTFTMSRRTRSAFYSISASAAAGLLLFQAGLNIFGPVDILPFTGVTLPFISAGGSSMIATWGLLAFIKAAERMSRADRPRVLKGDARPHPSGPDRVLARRETGEFPIIVADPPTEVAHGETRTIDISIDTHREKP